MLIDWFTVIAQVFNFLILVWVMKRFLYKPILKAIDAREKRITETVANAEVEKKQANQFKEDYQKKNKDFDQKRMELLNQAQEEVKGERKKLLDDVRTEANALKKKWQDSLNTEQKNVSEDIFLKAQNEIFSIVRKTLTDLAGVKLEEKITEVLINHLKELGEKEKNDFKEALKQSTAVVRSTFELEGSQRKKLQDAIKEEFEEDTTLNFETTPNLISGVEITVNGRRIAWSLTDYLESLKKSVSGISKVPTANNL